MSANDTQVGGTHYQSVFQHWDYAAIAFGPGYFKGNATKYIARWRKKNGVQDLEKARHYIAKLIELCDLKFYMNLGATHEGISAAINFCHVNDMDPKDGNLIGVITAASDAEMLKIALLRLDDMIATEKSNSA